MCHARQRVERELEPPVRIAHLAREAGLSPSHFIAQFSGLFGMTPLQCRTRARLERARVLLATTDEPATQIGLALGFENPGSFSRVFSRHFGAPPREWRRTGEAGGTPAGCVALMNAALGAHRDFGEVASPPLRQDGGSSTP